MADGPESATQGSGDAEEPLEPVGETLPPPPKPRGGLSNLRPFQKGKSGNPGGKKKGSGALSAALAVIADKRTPEELLSKIPPSVFRVIGKKPTFAQITAFRLFQMAIAGDVGALRLIFERLEGRVPVTPPMVEDDGQLDRLMEVLQMGPVPPGEVNE